MTDRKASTAAADLAPLHPTALTAGAWRSVGATFASLWPLWIVWSLYGAGTVYWQAAAIGQGASPRRLSYMAISSFGAAVMTGAATRAFLGGATPWWRLDARQGRFIILAGASNFLLQTPYLIPTVDRAHQTAANAGGIILLGLGQLFAVLVLAWAFIRLSLWPIGQLAEGRLMTARRSWRQMHGAFWPYLGAMILASGGPLIVTASLVYQHQINGAQWALFAQAPFAALAGLITAALGVEIYRVRVTAPDTMADVFD